ncbi:probable leucine-rich repeat receptor-like protein kinase At1g35710 [Dioscorea cayenensis subsp. rotundata]|uniref:non-specific serine/threonine protein kinase n=1 Tax=Dioscorea cayennensis subsp. rotundata TaxID=55577 RepID=A0AB40CCP4_DIOCR|nr:probable leucine-rich repeat receptor-like protein kinase At1g35710 [Dioscorea cayenensis subsp. rotundata]
MLLFLLLILLSSSALKCKSLTEAKALIRWKSSLFNPECLSSWSLNNSTNHCHWFGITCNSAGSIIELNLTNCNLNGTLEELDFSSLSNLTKLYLNNNMLNGSIPRNISTLSKPPCSIPKREVFQKSTYGAHDGNSAFCGNATVVVAVIILACRRWKGSGRVANAENYAMIWERGVEFKFIDIMEATHNFNEKYCIGRGNSGAVYKAELPSGQVLAVKRLYLEGDIDIFQINRKSFMNEIQMLTEVRHRNIVKLHGFCSRNGVMYLVYDYVERGSLSSVLYSDLGGTMFDWPNRVKVIHGVAHALAYLHNGCSPGIVHRDISINSILLDAQFEPQISDFGTSKLLIFDAHHWTAIVGSCGYIAPEIAYTMKYVDKCDVYSFGVAALEIIMGKPPAEVLKCSLRSGGNDVLLKDVLDQRLLPPTGQLAEHLVFLVMVALACTRTDPCLRPGMQEIAQEMSTRKRDYLAEPFGAITIRNLLQINC